ncbi:helix-turn-helix transcriptional regulator [Virgisporangium ochraceum]|uniref:AraC family transcriptional regulator n=1 Tax=Virgisporangium ochraceum TaxID=65505 RepID=A0A8J4EA44_9ACTN|nr:AraC family transcriptional regulator [Virgisporangium ochraceum]GIJ67361.1 AraC family transcriptional regulator [Virgisporangium ochraceum]
MTGDPERAERDSYTSGWHLADYGNSSLSEVKSLCQTYFGLSVVPELPEARLLYWFRAGRVGAVTVGEMRFGDEVRLLRPDSPDVYLVYVPLTGRMTTEHAGVVAAGSVNRAVVHRPCGPATVDRIRPFTTVLVVRLERAAVEQHLQTALGRSVGGVVEVAPWLDLTTRRGRTWLGLMQLTLDDIVEPDGAAADPTTAARLAAGAIAAFLSAADHPHRKELIRPERYRWPRPVRRAIEAMQADPAYPFTVADLAHTSGVGVRALQAAFHRTTGTSPMCYLRDLRLARAHGDLRSARPDTETVADVAHRWGFSHLGRFAAAYRQQFGVAPSVTLRE